MVRTDRPDAVHKLRVAARRLRSITAAVRPVLDRTATDPLREELRWLGRELSGGRDDEVALAHLRDLVAAEPEELVLGPVAARLQQTALKAAARGAGAGGRDALHAPLSPAAGRPARPARRAAADRPGVRAGPSACCGQAVRRVRTAAPAPAGRRRPRPRARSAPPRCTRCARPPSGRGTPASSPPDVLGPARQEAGGGDGGGPGRPRGGAGHRGHAASSAGRLGIAAAAAGENAWTYGRLHALEQARAERAERAFAELAPSLPRVLRRAAAKR